jgi:hypothetical protein
MSGIDGEPPRKENAIKRSWTLVARQKTVLVGPQDL